VGTTNLGVECLESADWDLVAAFFFGFLAARLGCAVALISGFLGLAVLLVAVIVGFIGATVAV
jgi:fatty acid desaturase